MAIGVIEFLAAWARLKSIRMKIRSNTTRKVTFMLLGKDAAYTNQTSAGGGLGIRVQCHSHHQPVFFTMDELMFPSWWTNGTPVPLTTVLPTVNAIQFIVSCSKFSTAGTCTNESGSLDIDDILVDLN